MDINIKTEYITESSPNITFLQNISKNVIFKKHTSLYPAPIDDRNITGEYGSEVLVLILQY